MVRYEGENLHVRIGGIDTPGKGHLQTDQSRDQFAALLKSSTTRIEILKRDVLRRLQCLVLSALPVRSKPRNTTTL